MFRRHKKLTAIGVVIAMFAMGGVAFAYWTQSGDGSGSASTGTTTDIAVIQDSAPTDLHPGGPAGDLSGHFSNPNSTATTISSVTAVVSPSFSSRADSLKPACTDADFTIGGSSGPYVVAPGTATTWSGLTISMVNTATNQDNCKGVAVPIDYTANA